MKKNLIIPLLFLCASLLVISFKPVPKSSVQKKPFNTYYCYSAPGVVATIDTGGTETLGYICLTLTGPSDRPNSTCTITNVMIASHPGCDTYTPNMTLSSGTAVKNANGTWAVSGTIYFTRNDGVTTGYFTLSGNWSNSCVMC